MLNIGLLIPRKFNLALEKCMQGPSHETPVLTFSIDGVFILSILYEYWDHPRLLYLFGDKNHDSDPWLNSILGSMVSH